MAGYGVQRLGLKDLNQFCVVNQMKYHLSMLGSCRCDAG